MSKSRLILPSNTIDIRDGTHTVGTIFTDGTIATAWPNGEQPYDNLNLEESAAPEYVIPQEQQVARWLLAGFINSGQTEVPFWFLEADFRV